jgi:serine/threonine protein kinase
VWKAFDQQLGREVAVKIFRSDAVTPEQIAEQERELRLLASLEHHGLSQLLDAGVGLSDRKNPRVYLVLGLIDGENLQRLSATAGPFNTRFTGYLGYDLAEALEYLHFHGVVHRDLKPANIVMTQYANSDARHRAKLVDFGIARLLDTLRTGEVIKGTAAYLSPEQALGRKVTSATDIYSLGLVLLECLTGELAFPGTMLESAKARITGDPHVPDSLSDDWRNVLRAMTARDPEARPTASDVLIQMRDILIADIGRRRSDR